MSRSFPCLQCQYKVTQKGCSQCCYKTTHISALYRHKRSIHDSKKLKENQEVFHHRKNNETCKADKLIVKNLSEVMKRFQKRIKR